MVRSGQGVNWPEAELAKRVVLNSKDAMAVGAQAAIISSPSTYHIKQAFDWLRENKPLLIEKPLSHNLIGLSDLKQLVKKSEIPVLIGYVLRYDQCAQQFHQMLKSKEVGDPLYVRIECSSYLPDWRPNLDYRKSVSARKAMGGGVLLELSHEIDYANWFFGPFMNIQASLQNSGTLEIETEDGADLFLRNLKGLPVSIHLDFYGKVPKRECRVKTSEGELVWNILSQKISWTDANGQIKERSFKQDRDKLFLRQLEHFFNCIDKNDFPKVSLQDGLDVMQIIEKAKKSNNLEK